MTTSPTTLALRTHIVHPTTLGPYQVIDKQQRRTFSAGAILTSRTGQKYRVARDGSFLRIPTKPANDKRARHKSHRD